MPTRGLFQGFRSSASNGVDTIGKSAKNYKMNVEFNLFHGFHVDISWVKGGPDSGLDDGSPGILVPPWDLEESASHNIARQRKPLGSELSPGSRQMPPNHEIYHDIMHARHLELA